MILLEDGHGVSSRWKLFSFPVSFQSPWHPLQSCHQLCISPRYQRQPGDWTLHQRKRRTDSVQRNNLVWSPISVECMWLSESRQGTKRSMVGLNKTALFMGQMVDRDRHSSCQGRKQVSSPGVERDRTVPGRQGWQREGKHNSCQGTEGRQVIRGIRLRRLVRNRQGRQQAGS